MEEKEEKESKMEKEEVEESKMVKEKKRNIKWRQKEEKVKWREDEEDWQIIMIFEWTQCFMGKQARYKVEERFKYERFLKQQGGGKMKR